MTRAPRVAIFGPNPILSVAVERRGEEEVDEIHFHPGGQGVWVARMAGELGAEPILCGFLGGEPGRVLRPLLEALPGELRLVETAVASGAYVVDRRFGERKVVSCVWSEPPTRHEVDSLFSIAVTAALESEVLAVCNPLPGEALPIEIYGNLVSDVRANGTPVIVDLSSPRLDSALDGEPELVKLNDWELAAFVRGPVSAPVELRAAVRKLLDRGAQSVLVTRGGDPAFAFRDDEAYELVPPRFVRGAREGCGDSMMGGIAAGWARGMSWEDALRLGAAAGAANFLRHGLGTGSRGVVEELVEKVELRRL